MNNIECNADFNVALMYIMFPLMFCWAPYQMYTTIEFGGVKRWV